MKESYLYPALSHNDIICSAISKIFSHLKQINLNISQMVRDTPRRTRAHLKLIPAEPRACDWLDLKTTSGKEKRKKKLTMQI